MIIYSMVTRLFTRFQPSPPWSLSPQGRSFWSVLIVSFYEPNLQYIVFYKNHFFRIVWSFGSFVSLSGWSLWNWELTPFFYTLPQISTKNCWHKKFFFAKMAAKLVAKLSGKSFLLAFFAATFIFFVQKPFFKAL